MIHIIIGGIRIAIFIFVEKSTPNADQPKNSSKSLNLKNTKKHLMIKFTCSSQKRKYSFSTCFTNFAETVLAEPVETKNNYISVENLKLKQKLNL